MNDQSAGNNNLEGVKIWIIILVVAFIFSIIGAGIASLQVSLTEATESGRFAVYDECLNDNCSKKGDKVVTMNKRLRDLMSLYGLYGFIAGFTVAILGVNYASERKRMSAWLQGDRVLESKNKKDKKLEDWQVYLIYCVVSFILIFAWLCFDSWFRDV